MRSSVVRGILTAGESVGEVAVIGLQDIDEGMAMKNELASYAKGEIVVQCIGHPVTLSGVNNGDPAKFARLAFSRSQNQSSRRSVRNR